MLAADVVVVGAGPAGIAAALTARESNRSVTVIDDNPAPGGQIWRGGSSTRWLRRFAAADVNLLSGAQIVSASAEDRTLLLEHEGRTLTVSFQCLILATGAREIFLPFPGWTLPGVMGVGGLQAMAKSGLPVRGKRIVVAGSGPLLLAVAAHLRSAGASIPVIAEQAPIAKVTRFAAALWRTPATIWEAAALRFSLAQVPYRTDCIVQSAQGTDRLQQVTLRRGDKTWVESCDYAAVAYGLCPNTELASALGCRIAWRAVAVDSWQQSSIRDIYCAGECTGIGGLSLALIEGQIAGYAATGKQDQARRLFYKRNRALLFASRLGSAFALRSDLRQLPLAGTIVCRCEDVPFSNLADMPSFRAAKLQTRCGMGPCQGRVCGPAVHFLFGWDSDTVRPPIFPASVQSLITATNHKEQ